MLIIDPTPNWSAEFTAQLCVDRCHAFALRCRRHFLFDKMRIRYGGVACLLTLLSLFLVIASAGRLPCPVHPRNTALGKLARITVVGQDYWERRPARSAEAACRAIACSENKAALERHAWERQFRRHMHYNDKHIVKPVMLEGHLLEVNTDHDVSLQIC